MDILLPRLRNPNETITWRLGLLRGTTMCSKHAQDRVSAFKGSSLCTTVFQETGEDLKCHNTKVWNHLREHACALLQWTQVQAIN